MWSVLLCRNHLSSFKGKGAYAKICNLNCATCRVLRYPLKFMTL
jgi:hypothetical protein